MCSNFESIHPKHANWVKHHFECDLPNGQWREEIYPTYPAPFIYLVDGKPKCEHAQLGLRKNYVNIFKYVKHLSLRLKWLI